MNMNKTAREMFMSREAVIIEGWLLVPESSDLWIYAENTQQFIVDADEGQLHLMSFERYNETPSF